MEAEQIQSLLTSLQLDGWLLYDFRGINPIALRLAGLEGAKLTRRWFCLVPKEGEPRWLVHRIEASHFKGKEGRIETFVGWQELQGKLRQLLSGCRKVAMEYSPQGSVPYVSRVDAGTIELICSLGVEVVSSADLVQFCEARLDDEQFALHCEAAKLVLQIKDEAFDFIRQSLLEGKAFTEFDVQQFILRRFAEEDLETVYAPCVACFENSSDPHYMPTQEKSKPIGWGDWVLIDLWAKKKHPKGVFADITWVGYTGTTVHPRFVKVFEVVKGARDAAVELLQKAVDEERPVHGFEVDDVARSFIAEHGYGEYFVHRTGHNIGTEVHGNGCNLDNLETKDERLLIPGLLFSIEPGIYIGEFGCRLEINVFMKENELVITTEPQNEIILL